MGVRSYSRVEVLNFGQRLNVVTSLGLPHPFLVDEVGRVGLLLDTRSGLWHVPGCVEVVLAGRSTVGEFVGVPGTVLAECCWQRTAQWVKLGVGLRTVLGRLHGRGSRAGRRRLGVGEMLELPLPIARTRAGARAHVRSVVSAAQLVEKLGASGLLDETLTRRWGQRITRLAQTREYWAGRIGLMNQHATRWGPFRVPGSDHVVGVEMKMRNHRGLVLVLNSTWSGCAYGIWISDNLRLVSPKVFNLGHLTPVSPRRYDFTDVEALRATGVVFEVLPGLDAGETPYEGFATRWAAAMSVTGV